MSSESRAERLERLFGSFRAESLREDLYRLFNEPRYFYYLAAPKSCILIGGRGSGKTTALKCMAYEGQAALQETDFKKPTYVGFYMRINTNTVASFAGPELSDEQWHRLFAHFMNLTICEEAANYISWLRVHTNDRSLDSSVNYTKISRSLGLCEVKTLDEFSEAIDAARLDLEIFINNFSGERPVLSPLQTPLNILMAELSKLEGHGRSNYYLILDEYENLLDYQQRIVNTLIKHAERNYFFKVGVRELGWREKSTINAAEVLISPADYERIRIEEALEDNFVDFAREVCKARLSAADLQEYGPSISVDKLLPSLTIKQEAVRLGVESRISTFRDYLCAHTDLRDVDDFHPHEIFVFSELSQHDPVTTAEYLRDFKAGKRAIKEKYDNYAYSFLFSISGKGAEIRKYYCGHNVLAKITYQNIRFYMQLVNACIREQFAAGLDISTPIDPRMQTAAARSVGLSYLRELEGVSVQGGVLARLLLGLGRVFQILAENPLGGKPECNQFEIASAPHAADSPHANNVRLLLNEAVMHLALIRTPGTKLTTELDIRSWDYMPHPIFAPYFGFSHRRKRKMSISEDDLVNLAASPQTTIKRILGRRSGLADETLPTQMSMFDEYFR